ncbi:MAG: ribonuclease E/G, partial [Proteobacteria bacterium SW_6_67_9]
LRDIGGLIVVDFIDMMGNKHQREVENRLREAAKMDRARVQMGRISRFGLLEMSRQRLQPSLGESASVTCPRCLGHGTIRSLGSLSLTILRIVGEEAMKESTERIVANVPVQIAAYLLNEKREQLSSVEQQNQVHILVIPDPALETPHYRIERVRASDREHASHERRSYELSGEAPDDRYVPPADEEQPAGEEPMVKSVAPSGPAPQPVDKATEPAPQRSQDQRADSGPGWLARITRALFTGGNDAADERQEVGQEGGTQRAQGTPQNAREGAERAHAKSGRDRDRSAKRGGDEPEAERNRRSRGGRNRRGGRGRSQQQRDDSNAQEPESRRKGSKQANRSKSAGGASRDRGSDASQSRAPQGQAPGGQSTPTTGSHGHSGDSSATATPARHAQNESTTAAASSPATETPAAKSAAKSEDQQADAASTPQGEQAAHAGSSQGTHRSRSRGRSRRGGRRRRGGRQQTETSASSGGDDRSENAT